MTMVTKEDGSVKLLSLMLTVFVSTLIGEYTVLNSHLDTPWPYIEKQERGR